MKTKIILGLATLATLTLPAMAEGNRYRDQDQRAQYPQVYRYDGDRYARSYDGDRYRNYDRDDAWRREAAEQRERREQMQRHEYIQHHQGFYR